MANKSRYDRSDPAKVLLTKALPIQDEDQRSTKRVKMSDGPETIELRMQDGAYSSVESVIEDLQTVIRQESAISNGTSLEPVGETIERAQNGSSTSSAVPKFKALQEALDKFVLERAQQQEIKPEDSEEDSMNQIPEAATSNDRLVLTLFGSTDRGARQLFSSLQLQPNQQIEAEKELQQAYPKIAEDYLPNGITTSKVVPFNAQGAASEKKETRKFGQIFRPPPSLKPLEPPRPAVSTSDNKITWSKSNEDILFNKATPVDKADHKFAKLPAGQWLKYADSTTSKATNSKTLFQAAYSSFAPVRDNGDATIAASIKNQMWWKRAGAARYQSLLRGDEDDLEASDFFVGDSTLTLDDNFADVVASFVPEDPPFPEMKEDENGVEEKDIEELMEEISDQLKTLASYQRLRYSVDPSRGTPGNRANSFTEPSDTEHQVHTMLKTQLALIVSQLPPYAVAKLDADHLKTLEIGTNIITTRDDYAGVMEVDDYTFAKQRATASANAAVNRPTANPPARPGSYNSAAATTPATYNHRAFATARPAAPSTPYSRPAYNGATPSQNYANTGRPAPQTMPRYGSQQNSFSNSPNLQHFQRPLPNGYSGSYNSHQQAQNAVSSLQRPTQPGYQQRAQDNAARSTSPPKPFEMGSRPAFAANPTAAQQARYFPQHQAPGGIQGTSSPHPQTPNAAPVDHSRFQPRFYAPNARPSSTTPQPPAPQYPQRSDTSSGGQQNGVTHGTVPAQGQQ